MAYGARLESGLGRKLLAGSNPALSATKISDFIDLEQIFTYTNRVHKQLKFLAFSLGHIPPGADHRQGFLNIPI